MWAFVKYVAKVRPEIAVFESVQQAFTRPDGLDLMRRLRAHLEELTGDLWTLHHVRHNAYSVGGCAQRKRYFWLVSRIPFGVEPPKPRNLPLLRHVIGDLDNLEDTWAPQPYRQPAWHEWSDALRSPSGFVDGHVTLNIPHSRRIAELLRSEPWYPGEPIQDVLRRHYRAHGTLPPSYTAATEKLAASDFSMGFTTPCRWNGDKVARVITGGAMGLVIHPWVDRLLTHRECARVLGFPDDWKIKPLKRITGLPATWGKGISVACGKWIGEWIKRALDREPGDYTGVLMGEREFDIDFTHSWKQGVVEYAPTTTAHRDTSQLTMV